MNYLTTDKKPRGDIWVRGCILDAYFKNEEATKETIDSENFVHTGDGLYK